MVGPGVAGAVPQLQGVSADLATVVVYLFEGSRQGRVAEDPVCLGESPPRLIVLVRGLWVRQVYGCGRAPDLLS